MIFELNKDSKKIIATIQRNGDTEKYVYCPNVHAAAGKNIKNVV